MKHDDFEVSKVYTSFNWCLGNFAVIVLLFYVQASLVKCCCIRKSQFMCKLFVEKFQKV